MTQVWQRRGRCAGLALTAVLLLQAGAASAACRAEAAVKVDLATWRRLATTASSPAALNRLLAQLRLPPVEEMVEQLGGPPCPPKVDAVLVQEAPLSSAASRDQLVQVRLSACDQKLVRAQVLRPEGPGTYCAVAGKTLSAELSGTDRACLDPPPPDKPSRLPLVLGFAELIDARRKVLRVLTQTGGCNGIQRGAEFTVSFRVVGPEQLTEVLKYTLYRTLYRSPTPPTQEEETRLSLSGGYPRVVTLRRQVSCRKPEPGETPPDPCTPSVVTSRQELRGERYQAVTR